MELNSSAVLGNYFQVRVLNLVLASTCSNTAVAIIVRSTVVLYDAEKG